MEVGGRAKGLGCSCILASFPGSYFAQVSDACLSVWKSTLASHLWVQVTAEIQSEASRQ